MTHPPPTPLSAASPALAPASEPPLMHPIDLVATAAWLLPALALRLIGYALCRAIDVVCTFLLIMWDLLTLTWPRCDCRRRLESANDEMYYVPLRGEYLGQIVRCFIKTLVCYSFFILFAFCVVWVVLSVLTGQGHDYN